MVSFFLESEFWKQELRQKFKKKEQKDFSLTAESHDTSWMDVATDSSKILCLCKHIANIKLKALVITIHENKAEMSFRAPLVRNATAPWNWNIKLFCLNRSQLLKRFLNLEYKFKCYNNYKSLTVETESLRDWSRNPNCFELDFTEKKSVAEPGLVCVHKMFAVQFSLIK